MTQVARSSEVATQIEKLEQWARNRERSGLATTALKITIHHLTEYKNLLEDLEMIGVQIPRRPS